ncbi:MAG: Flp pilus assembly protein CpaB [Kiritimatiellae bacterium]|nr:Flp pilus assembly protein CpaB [Kiritimatiellia bacterium]
MKQKLVLIASVVIGLVAAMLTKSYLTAKDREVAAWKRQFDKTNLKITVAGVKRAIPSGTVLKAEDIGQIDIIERSVRGHVVKIADYLALVERRTIRALEKDSPIFWSDIEGGDPKSRGLSGDIKDKMRAIAVNVSGSGSVSGMVQPTDHVDVLGTFSFPSKDTPAEMELVTMTILQDVLVLATGKETAKSMLLATRPSSGSYNTVTLEVTPREAEILVFAEQIKGRLTLALRNPRDVYYEKSLPRVDFKQIQAEIGTLNEFRQNQLLRKPSK